MNSHADTDLELVCFNTTGLFCFTDPFRVEQGRESGFVQADAEVRFAQGPGSYELTVYREHSGGWGGCVSKIEIRPATGLVHHGAYTLAGTVPVDTGTIVAFDPATVLENTLAYDDLFSDFAVALPEEEPTFFSFSTGVGDGRYQVMCDDKDAATIVSITFIAEDEDEDEWTGGYDEDSDDADEEEEEGAL